MVLKQALMTSRRFITGRKPQTPHIYLTFNRTFANDCHITSLRGNRVNKLMFSNISFCREFHDPHWPKQKTAKDVDVLRINSSGGFHGIFHGPFCFCKSVWVFRDRMYCLALCLGNASVAAVPSFQLARAPALQLCRLRSMLFYSETT